MLCSGKGQRAPNVKVPLNMLQLREKFLKKTFINFDMENIHLHQGYAEELFLCTARFRLYTLT